MTKTRVWMAVGILGVALALADLVMRFGFGRDSFLGWHVHLITIVDGQTSRQDFVIPALVGAVVALIGFAGFVGARRSTGHS